MRDAELIYALKVALAAFPSQRIGQVLSNACTGKDLFYLSDRDLARLLREYVEKYWQKEEEKP